jgi:hypothetical protein
VLWIVARWERERIAVEQGAPPWLMHRSVNQSRRTVRRYVLRMKRVPKPEPVRAALRLSLVEREEISRGLAGGESLRAIATRLGRLRRRLGLGVGRGRLEAWWS